MTIGLRRVRLEFFSLSITRVVNHSRFFADHSWESLVETAVEGQSLTAGDQRFILMQAGSYLTPTRGSAAPEARICYERVESLSGSLSRPLLLYTALMGHWRYSLVTDKVTATIQIAKQIYSLAQRQNDPALLIEAYGALATPLYFLGDFEVARQYGEARCSNMARGRRTASDRRGLARGRLFVL
jgi:hypothetical protein